METDSSAEKGKKIRLKRQTEEAAEGAIKSEANPQSNVINPFMVFYIEHLKSMR